MHNKFSLVRNWINETVIQPRILLVAALLLTLGLQAQTVRYVKAGGTGDGSSWAMPLGDFQNAIDVSGYGDIVWVAAGTYQAPSEGSFHMKNGIAIYGGFPNNDSTAEMGDRNPAAHPVILLGNNASVFNNTSVSAAVLDGFTISGGTGTSGSTQGGGGNAGGGMRNKNCDLLINNCIFKNNFAANAGGALYNETSTVVITNSLFYNNSSSTGAAVCNYMYANVKFVNVTITQNNGNSTISDSFYTTLTLQNSIIYNNSASPANQIIISYSTATSQHSLGADNMGNGGGSTINSYNNVTGNPQFTNPANGDFSIALSSPAANAGDSTLLSNASSSKDLAGNPRLVGPQIDLGAYESASLIPSGNTIIRYVKVGGTGNGLSWATAAGDLSEVVSQSVAGHQIWVAAGTYPQSSLQPLSMKEGVAMYGGFPDNDNTTGMAQRNPSLYQTILDGNGQTAITNENLTGASVLDGFVITGGYDYFGGGMHNTNASPTISNCIFRDNSAFISGAAIYNNNSSPIVTNTLFYNNSASSNGGAIYGNGASSPRFINVTFTQNSAANGGAVYVGTGAETVLHNCILWNNSASGNGDEVNAVEGSVTAKNCLIINNADNVVGPFNADNTVSGDPVFVDAASNNFAIKASGAATNGGDTSLFANAPIAKDLAGNPRVSSGQIDIGAYEASSSRFVKQGGTGAGTSWADASGNLQQTINQSAAGEQVWVAEGTYQPASGQYFAMKEGVGIYGGFPNNNNAAASLQRNPSLHPTILSGNGTRVIFNLNLSAASVLDGFVIANGNANTGGGMHNENSSPTISNCIFRNNTATNKGGGLYNYGAPVITNCVFHNNTASYGAGTCSDYPGNVKFVNVTFSKNTATSGGGALYSNNGSTTKLYNSILYENVGAGYGNEINNANGTVTTDNCLITAGAYSILGTVTQQNTMAGNPFFINPATGNFSIAPYGAAFNTGNAAFFTNAANVNDLAANPRLTGPQIDLGAYESTFTGPTATGPVRYVKQGGTGNGASWEFAAGNIQDMINLSASGQEVWVAEGTYRPAAGQSFNMKDGIKIYGGFANNNNAAVMADRSPAAHPVILAGNGSRVISNTSISSAALLDGFIISGGSNIADGAGMYNLNASPTITNCIFRNNTASSRGGAIFNVGSTSLVTNSLFYNNQANVGGAVCQQGNTSRFVNVTFTKNSAVNGGALAFEEFYLASIVIDNCILWNNTATGSGKQIFAGNNNSVSAKNSLLIVDSANVTGTFNPFGVVSGDPTFTDAANDNFTLAEGSFAINGGNDSLFPNAAAAMDLAGNPRLRGPRIDMGAYESDSTAPPLGAIRYVKPGGAGNGDGFTWANASGNLQLMITNAGPGHEVWVAQGTYTPAAGQSFIMKDKVRIYGGFPANDISATMEDRDVAAYETILAGNGSRVINNTNLTALTVLDGFTITGGSGVNQGAGMYNNQNSSPTIANCTFRNNVSGIYGGAMYNVNSSPAISNCVFRDNNGGYFGGAIYSNSGTIVVSNSLFYNNRAINEGGAVHHTNGNTKFINVTFTKNTSTEGGALWTSGSTLQLQNCILWDNTASRAGSQIKSQGGTVTAVNCLLAVNGNSISGPFNHTNTVYTDPLFTDPANNDFTLTNASPAINNGDTSLFANAATAVDLAGNPRLVGPKIDRGAYESSSLVPVPEGFPISYVKQGGTGNGSSWANASGNLQQMIEQSPTGEVWVAKGTYQPMAGQSFSMREGVKIYGGFPADNNGAGMADRNPAANKVTLTGNGYRVIDNAFLSSASILNGFTVSGGSGVENGAGMQNDNASPTIVSCIFRNNTASQRGGAMYNINSVATVHNSLFYDNQAGSGGAAFDQGSSGVRYVNVTFTENIAGNGGAIHTLDGAATKIDNCILWNNDATGSGDQINSGNGSSVTAVNCLTKTNSVNIGGTFTHQNTVSGNPLFTNAANDDFTLTDASPAVNSGNSALFTNVATITDLGGNPRFTGPAIDRGAYESSSTAPVAPAPLLPIRYVKQGGTGNGASWATASGELQEMIDASVPGNQVWVARGDYQPESGASFNMKEGVAIYGGFPDNNDSAAMSDRNWKVNVTKLSGNGARVIQSNNIISGTLDGFIITGGNAAQGGGIIYENSAAVLKNLLITGNSASQGGGIYARPYQTDPLSQNPGANVNVTLENITVKGNNAGQYGGGIYIYGSNNLNLNIINSEISANTAADSGAAIILIYGRITLTNVVLADNTAPYDAVITGISPISPKFLNCTITGNAAEYEGGVTAYWYGSDIIFQNCISWNNSSAAGVIYGNFDGYNNIFQNCIVEEGNTGNNTLNADPLFANSGNGNYRLTAASPAANAGDTSLYSGAAAATDLGGNARVYGGTIDMGAYEYQVLDCNITTIWNGNNWSNGTPESNEYAAVIAGNYTSTGNINACSLTVSSGAVTVKSGHNFIIRGAVNVTGGSMLFEQNSNLVQVDNAANTGTITYKRNSSLLYGLDYTIWSSPVSGSQTLKQFSPLTVNERFYIYNTILGAYSNYQSASGVFGGSPEVENFDTGKGYLIRMPAGLSANATSIFTGTFTGTPNNGNITAPTEGSGTRYNAVGNPYPSPINVKDFLTANAQLLDNGTIYFWRKRNATTGTAYATVTLAAYVAATAEGGDTSAGAFEDGDEDNWVINPGQGFQVKTATAQDHILFNNSMRRAVNNGQFFRTANTASAAQANPMSKMWLNITNAAGEFGQAAIVYSNVTTPGLDYGYDGRLFNDGVISIYTMAEDTRLSIQARSAFAVADEVPLGYKVTTAGSYTISLDHFTGVFQEGQVVYLKDNLLNTTHNLSDGSYTFTSGAAAVNNRFTIVYATVLGTEQPELQDDAVMIWKKQGGIEINTSSIVMSGIKVLDIRGRLLYSRTNVNASAAEITGLTAEEQVLVVEVTTTEGTIISKKIIY
jgi:predicted outer membrane repeat protein